MRTVLFVAGDVENLHADHKRLDPRPLEKVVDMSGATPIGPVFANLLATQQILYGWSQPGFPNEGVYQYSGEPNNWRKIADAMQFSSIRASHKNLYGWALDGTAWCYAGEGTNWVKIGDGFSGLSAGGDGVIGIVGPLRSAGTFSLFDETTKTWSSLGGTGWWAMTDGTHHVSFMLGGDSPGLSLFDQKTGSWTPIGATYSSSKLLGGQLFAATGGDALFRYLGSPGQWGTVYPGYGIFLEMVEFDGNFILVPGIPHSTQVTSTAVAMPITSEVPAWSEFYSGTQSIGTLAATSHGLFASGPELGTVQLDPPRAPMSTRQPPAATTKWTVMVRTGSEAFSGYDGQVTINLQFAEGTAAAVIPKSHFERDDLYFFDIEVQTTLKTFQSVVLFGSMNYFDDQWHLGGLSVFDPTTSHLYEYTVDVKIGNGSMFATQLGAPTDTRTNTYPPGVAHVYVWDYLGINVAMGHASIELEDGTYISWWPGQVRNPKTLATQIGYPHMLYCGPANPNQTFQDDQILEAGAGQAMKAPDHSIEIGGLDIGAIRTWWSTFQKTNQWCTFSQNCSTTVADALWAGGVKNRLSVAQYAYYRAPTWPWTPAGIYDFVQAINSSTTHPS